MKEFLRNNIIKMAVAAAVFVLCLFISRETYPALILAYIAIYSIGTSGLDLLFGFSGQISMGHAAYFAIGAYTSAILATKYGLNPFFGILIGSIFATVAGLLLAIPASKLVKHFLSLMTIAFGQVVYMFVNVSTKITGGSTGIRNIPYISIFGYELNTYRKNFVFATLLLILVLIVKRNIINSRTGRAFMAIKENTAAAEGMGINVPLFKVMAFGTSALFMGLAGGLYAHLVTYISPETFNNTQSVLFMTMVLFGGIQSLMGPIVGSAVLMLVKEVFQFLQIYQVLIYGVFILIVLFFFPNGIVGIFSSIMRSVRRRKENSHAEA